MSKIIFIDILRSHGSWSLKCLKMVDYLLGSLLAFILPVQKKQTFLPKSIHKILIIRPGGMGDAVFLLPIFKSLKTRGIAIEVLCEPRNAEIFTSQGYPVHFYNRLNQLWRVFRNSYDVIIDTEQWHYLSAIVAYFIKTECRIGFATRLLRAKLFNKQVPYGDNDYELDNFLRLFDGLLLPEHNIQDINDCFDIPELMQAWAAGQISQQSITVFLGASIAVRRFSKEQLLTIIRDLLLKNYHPVLLGGDDVSAMAQGIMKEVNDQRISNFIGQASLIQSAALIQRSQKFIGPDSGLMHVGCAVGTPVVAVFGPGNLHKWQPKGSGHNIITEKVSCSPCTRFGYTVPTCRGSYHCMRGIKVEKIIKFADKTVF